MKCEIENCNKDTDSFLCADHSDMAMNKNVVFKICKKCNTIIDIRTKLEKVEPDKQYIFVEECQTCNFK